MGSSLLNVVCSTTVPPSGQSSTTWQDELQPSILPFQLCLPLSLWMWPGFLVERNVRCDMQQLRPLESGSTHLPAWVSLQYLTLFSQYSGITISFVFSVCVCSLINYWMCWWWKAIPSYAFSTSQPCNVRPFEPCPSPCLWTAPILWGTSALARSVSSPVKRDFPWMAQQCCFAPPLGFGLTACLPAQVNRFLSTFWYSHITSSLVV